MFKTRNPQKTRQEILQSAAREIHRLGFTGASVNDILKSTGVTRGALYHHFPNKKALGLAVLDHLAEGMRQMWLEPLAANEDPITTLKQILEQAAQTMQAEDIILGCPLNNLAQEMSPQDEEFRRRLVEVYNQFRGGIAAALGKGQEAGLVNRREEPLEAATFFVATITGGRGLSKTAQSPDILIMCSRILIGWLDTLRP